MRIAVIGSAGRGTDKDFLSKDIYVKMYNFVLKEIDNLFGTRSDCITLVSGGAAYADHIAVRLFLHNIFLHKTNKELILPPTSLELHFPSKFENKKFEGEYKSDGSVANYYHKLFSERLGIKSLHEINAAINQGAIVNSYSGFHERNLEVGKVDALIALTFGSKSGTYINVPELKDGKLAGLKDGGTLHTYNNSSAGTKIHKNINDFIKVD